MYKRNQIEEAISRLFGESSPKPSSELRTRVKRLLDLDRSLGRTMRSKDPASAHYAFYSEDSPGKGVEILFSEYEAFALSIGLRLMEHGWPQSFAVATLRRLRPELEQHHSRFLKQKHEVLFDEVEIQKSARAGGLGFNNTDPVILTIVSGRGKKRRADVLPACAVCRGMKEVSDFVKTEKAEGWSLHELVTPGHSLSSLLKSALPRRRGRAG